VGYVEINRERRNIGSVVECVIPLLVLFPSSTSSEHCQAFLACGSEYVLCKMREVASHTGNRRDVETQEHVKHTHDEEGSATRGE
jgi:hypothetical protein